MEQPKRDTDLARNPVPPPSESPYEPPSPFAPGQAGRYTPPGYGVPRPQASHQSKEWRDAPSTVRAVRMLTVLGIVLAALFILVGALTAASPSSDSSAGSVPGIIMLLAGVVVLVLGILYYRLLTIGFTGVWYIQIILSGLALILNLLGLAAYVLAPSRGADSSYAAGQLFGTFLGIAIHGSILFYWFKRDVKTWFGIY